jgi:short-subunit dehydrogenase
VTVLVASVRSNHTSETQEVAAGGIGRAMTRGLAGSGHSVASVDRDRELLEGLAATARGQGKAAELFTM